MSRRTFRQSASGNAFAFIRAISANTTNYDLRTAMLAAGWSGSTPANVTLTINSGIYVYSTSTGSPAFTTGTFPTGSRVTIINNGYIMGMGGAGGITTAGASGGPAMSLTADVMIDTSNGYILGGGGGGGASYFNLGNQGGGGGAGGGAGGGGTAGGGVGASGSTGSSTNGGGGGRVVPPSVTAGVYIGSNGSVGGTGGSGGGAGGAMVGLGSATSGSGGAYGGGGSGSFISNSGAGGGGGGYGASGGSGSGAQGSYGGGSGGAAIILNGKTITWVNAHTNVYGSVA